MPDPFSLALPIQASNTAKPTTDAARGSQATSDNSKELQLTVRIPETISWGETASVSVEVVSIKGKAGGSPAELTLDPLSPVVLAAGKPRRLHVGYCMMTLA